MMKKSFIFFCALAWVLLLSGCDYKAEFIREPTPLRMKVRELKCRTVNIDITPDNDRVYYGGWAYPKEDFQTKTAKELYQETLDFFRILYQTQIVEPAKEGDYVCSFADYALYYSKSNAYIDILKPGTDYVYVAFCINPDTQEIMGEANTIEFRTLSMDSVPTPDMQLDFMLVDDPADSVVRYYVKPTTSEGKISKDYFVVEYCVAQDVLDSKYGGSLKNYVDEFVAAHLDYETSLGLDIYMHKDIYERYIELDEPFQMERLVEGKTYVLWAFPYCTDYGNNIWSMTFTYTKGMKIDYTHDPR